MKYFKSTKVLLVMILIVACFLRLPLLGQLPEGITIDEAGQGYSAYSILKTGRDEWGDFLPLNPRGFGDYKPPVFMYLLVPSIAIFGLNEFAVRFPSAISGIFTVWVLFFLVSELFKNKKLGLLSSFMIAISPWHVYYSRLGWESNVGLLLFVLGIWLFLKGIKIQKWLVFSVVSFGLSSLSYHSFKLLVPLMVLGLITIFRREFSAVNKKMLILPGITVLIFVLILGYGFIFSGAGNRVQDQAILKEDNLTALRESQFNDRLPRPLNLMLNNKLTFLLSTVTDNYLGYFSLSFLFGPHRSDGSVLNFPTEGLLYIWQLPLILFGVFYLITRFSDASKLLFLWALIAPIPAALTQDYMHAGRAQAIFPALAIISVVGFKFIFEDIKSYKLKRLVVYLSMFIILISLIFRIDNYLFNTFNKFHGGLVKGYRDIINYTQNNQDKYDRIVFTTSNSEPQAFIAFYTKWDPSDFQNQSKIWKDFEKKNLRFLDMSEYSLGKYDFRKVDISRDRHVKNALLVGTKNEIPPYVDFEYTVKDATGKMLFLTISTNEIPD